MSRVYDALQQCLPDQVSPGLHQESRADALFSEQFTDSEWDLNAAATVQPNLSREDRLPALFETYSFASEQFRLLATRLQQLQKSRALKSVLLTSGAEGDGKSLSTLNLALSLAQGGQKVLLIDADLRKSGVSLMLKVDGRVGLKEWHRTNCSMIEVICRVASLNLWVLPAGQAAVDPLELLNSTRIPDLLASLNAVFDWVLIDSPPLLPLADAEVLSRISDGTIIVVRRDKSPKSALKQALERVAPSKMVGFLLNEFPTVGSYGHAKYAVQQPLNGPRL
jgi:capsular exopolysaccharide synthesis family protein